MSEQLHYSYQQLFKTAPNQYNFLYFPISTNSFVKKNEILQKTFPQSHIYFPNKSNIIEKRNIYPLKKCVYNDYISNK